MARFRHDFSLIVSGLEYFVLPGTENTTKLYLTSGSHLFQVQSRLKTAIYYQIMTSIVPETKNDISPGTIVPRNEKSDV